MKEIIRRVQLIFRRQIISNEGIQLFRSFIGRGGNLGYYRSKRISFFVHLDCAIDVARLEFANDGL